MFITLWGMHLTDTTATAALDRAREKTFLGHPRGLVICFLTEMWERFSYYGMRGLLLLYLTQHFLFSDQRSNLIYGAYIALVYIMSIIGGVLSDKYLGQRKAVTFGAILLVLGHFGMAFEGATTGASSSSIMTVRPGASSSRQRPMPPSATRPICPSMTKAPATISWTATRAA